MLNFVNELDTFVNDISINSSSIAFSSSLEKIFSSSPVVFPNFPYSLYNTVPSLCILLVVAFINCDFVNLSGILTGLSSTHFAIFFLNSPLPGFLVGPLPSCKA